LRLIEREEWVYVSKAAAPRPGEEAVVVRIVVTRGESEEA
jgi:hypothetical protein